MSMKPFSRVAGAALLVLIMMTAGTGDAFAQRGAPADADRMISRLQAQLELTDAQVDELRPILQAHAQQRSEMMRQAREARTPLRDNPEFMQLRQQHREQVEAVLTTEQIEAYREMPRLYQNRNDRRPGMRGGQGVRGPAAGFDRMFERLNLTEEQQAQMRDLMTRQREQRGQTQSNFREQMSEILTDEQRAEWESMRTENPNRGERRMAPRRGNR